MFTRMTRWAKHQPDAIQVTMELVHDQAELNDDFLKLKNGSVPITQGETGTGQIYPVLCDTITAYYKMPTHTANYNGGNYVTDSITSGNISAKNNTLHF